MWFAVFKRFWEIRCFQAMSRIDTAYPSSGSCRCQVEKLRKNIPNRSAHSLANARNKKTFSSQCWVTCEDISLGKYREYLIATFPWQGQPVSVVGHRSADEKEPEGLVRPTQIPRILLETMYEDASSWSKIKLILVFYDFEFRRETFSTIDMMVALLIKARKNRIRKIYI